jgi:hypothetical protein
MTQHNRDALPDVSGDASPCRTRPKSEWLRCVLAKWRREQLQGFDVGIIHDLTPQIRYVTRERNSGDNTDIILITGEVTKLQAPAYTGFAVLLRRSEEQTEPVIHERSAVATRCPKVD